MDAKDRPAARAWWIDAFDATYPGRYEARDDTEARRVTDLIVARGLVRASDRVLDLCCGAGRHLAALRDRGARPVGLDLSPALLAIAWAQARARAGRQSPLVRGDMRALPFRGAAFDAVIQMFTAFGYFESDAENRRVIEEVARVLRPGGAYVLDVFNLAPAVALATGSARTERSLADGSLVRERRRYDPARRRVEKTMEIVRGGAIETRFESVRAFERDELAAWLTAAGLAVAAVLGDYDGAPHDPARSPRMMFVAMAAG